MKTQIGKETCPLTFLEQKKRWPDEANAMKVKKVVLSLSGERGFPVRIVVIAIAIGVFVVVLNGILLGAEVHLPDVVETIASATL